jgi:hypothetical protein
VIAMRLYAAALSAALAAASGCADKPKPGQVGNRPGSSAPTPSGPQGCSKESMADETLTLRETTNPTLSEHQVGISNIFERDLPDASGAVASRLSAVLVIFDPKTKQTRRETVIADGVVTIGADRYCVVKLEEGKSAPGSITVRKLAPAQ